MTTSLHSPAEFLRAERICLRPIEPDDVPLLHRWANDPELRGLTGETCPTTYAAALEYYEKVQSDLSRLWLAVVVRETQQLIGETGLLRMFPAWRATDWSLIIGSPAARSQGYGSEAAWLMLNYAFGHLSLHRVAVGVVGFNTAALRFYESLGFKREGLQRDGYYFNHRFHDFVMLSLLEDEFRLRWRERLGK